MYSLLKDSQARQRMSVNNMQLARSFTAEAVTPRYLEVYQQLVAS
jgi:hypothetical protein